MKETICDEKYTVPTYQVRVGTEKRQLGSVIDEIVLWLEGLFLGQAMRPDKAEYCKEAEQRNATWEALKSYLNGHLIVRKNN